jgi:hypothetical protein
MNHVVRNAALGKILDKSRDLTEIDQSIIKAVSPLETSPKRYDFSEISPNSRLGNTCVQSSSIPVRILAPLLFTCADLFAGDHKNATAFWAALKVQPIIQSGIQTWKALILVLRGIPNFVDDLGSQGYARRTQIRIVCLAWMCPLTRGRRESANQTQWFDGIIRTVRCWLFVRLIDPVEHGTNLWTIDRCLCVLPFGENQVPSESP